MITYRSLSLVAGLIAISLSSLQSQTYITFSIDQPVTPFEVNAGEDQVYDNESTITLGSEPTASGGFENYSYQWDHEEFLDDPTSANPEVVSLNGPITFTVLVTDIELGCIKEDQVYVDFVVSVPLLDKPEIKAYPSPFRDEVIVEANEPIKQILIYDMTGKTVNQYSKLPEIASINTNHLKPGIYFFQIQVKNGATKTFKLCK